MLLPQYEEGKKAEETQETFRGQLLHLMSLLHCFACLVRPRQLSSLLPWRPWLTAAPLSCCAPFVPCTQHLMRREEVEREAGQEEEEKEKDDDDDDEGESEGEGEGEEGSSSDRQRRDTAAWLFKACRTPDHQHKKRPAHRQLNNLLDARCFRVRPLCRSLCRQASGAQDRFDLGVMGELKAGEKRALYPPWDVTSKHIESVLYRNHELPGCCHYSDDKKIHDDTSNVRHKHEKMHRVVEANMFDRVSLIMGWIVRLVGQRRHGGGLWVPPPVLTRPYVPRIYATYTYGDIHIQFYTQISHIDRAEQVPES